MSSSQLPEVVDSGNRHYNRALRRYMRAYCGQAAHMVEVLGREAGRKLSPVEVVDIDETSTNIVVLSQMNYFQKSKLAGLFASSSFKLQSALLLAWTGEISGVALEDIKRAGRCKARLLELSEREPELTPDERAEFDSLQRWLDKNRP